MQRYTVTIVSPGTADTRPVLAVPFEPDALISAFIDELLRRVVRQGLQLGLGTHLCTLHLDSETGAILDSEDLLGEVIVDPMSDKLFAVFEAKLPTGTHTTKATSSTTLAEPAVPTEDQLAIRVITPELAKYDPNTLPVIHVAKSATINELHQKVADHLKLPHSIDKPHGDECNCNLGKQLADGPCLPTEVTVILGKSDVRKLQLPAFATEAALDNLLRTTFDADLFTKKKVLKHGFELHGNLYKKPPVVTICSKDRHIPLHAKADFDAARAQVTRRVLDLHTSEQPFSRACDDSTLVDAGLEGLISNGAISIYAINRSASSVDVAGSGKSSIFRHQACWEPTVKQSDRGIAMFLSSLRVFASTVQDLGRDERIKDGVYHIFDILTRFPPALRTLHILAIGATPSAAESAAFSAMVFEVLDGFMPTAMIGHSRTRLFEGSRLLFGFILEKARTVKLAEDASDVDSLPYLSAFESVDLRDHKTSEAVMHVVRTAAGPVERTLFNALDANGCLRDSHIQTYMLQLDSDVQTARVALLSGGCSTEIVTFLATKLSSNYTYPDSGSMDAVFEKEELTDLHHLAELCGRNHLTTHKPSQLVSAVAPCLTLDRAGHLAVYTGQLPCSDPGKSSEIFRPRHGTETVDEAVLEQLLAPILAAYEASGTAVFDVVGGSAAIRRLQAPDEVLMFAVDVSASMRQATDFEEVNDEAPFLSEPVGASALVEPELYNRATYEDTRQELTAHESFTDMVAIVSDAAGARRRFVATEVLELLRITLSSQVVKKHADVEARKRPYWARMGAQALKDQLHKLKLFFAGLKTHEQSIVDFLLFRAATSPDIGQDWKWNLGDSVPSGPTAYLLPGLPTSITMIPDVIMCPISHTIMHDAVTAGDNVTYSRSAIEQWFTVRGSSPMHGLPLADTTLRANVAIASQAAEWISGKDLLPTPAGLVLLGSRTIKLGFVSRDGAFERTVASTTTLADLYKFVFRGLGARYQTFQLARSNGDALQPTATTVGTSDLESGTTITVRLADDANMVVSGLRSAATRTSAEQCLVKVYTNSNTFAFGLWVRKDTPLSVAALLWKYWRHKFQNNGMPVLHERQIWSDLTTSGDGLSSGSPRDSDERLSSLLNRGHCRGQLAEEPLYSTDDNESPMTAGDRRLSTDSTLVLKVKVSDVWAKRKVKEGTKLTRLDVLKQMFEALINRLIAYNINNHIGLVSFQSTARVAQPISHVIENFRKAVSELDAHGDTALWDALKLAQDQIKQYAARYPQAKKRIFVISDGANTKATENLPHDVAFGLMQDNIVVDSVCLGDEDNSELKAVAYLLDGYRFQPDSLESALSTCELEPVLSLAERPPTTLPPGTCRNRLQYRSTFMSAKYRANTTIVTADDYPERKAHPNLDDEFVELSTELARRSANSTRSNLRTTRIMNEINRVVTNSDDRHYDVYVSETDFSFWKVVMAGPEGTPYEGHCFLMYLHMGERFPTHACEARFVTKIQHPNVNAHGRICHALLSRDWTSDVSLTTVLDTIYGLLLQAETSDPVNTAATLGYHHDQVEYEEAVREFCRRHASKTAEEWRSELLGYDDEEDEEMDEADQENSEDY